MRGFAEFRSGSFGSGVDTETLRKDRGPLHPPACVVLITAH